MSEAEGAAPLESFNLCMQHLGGNPPVYQVDWEVVKYTGEPADVQTHGDGAFVLRPGQTTPKLVINAMLGWVKGQM